MSYETANILDAAADVTERDGWHQGAFYPGASEYGYGPACAENTLPKCARGAIYAAAPSLNVYQHGTVITALTRHLGLDSSCSSVPRWNDAPERTEQEVLDALRLAAKQERIAADLADQGGAL